MYKECGDTRTFSMPHLFSIDKWQLQSLQKLGPRIEREQHKSRCCEICPNDAYWRGMECTQNQSKFNLIRVN